LQVTTDKFHTLFAPLVPSNTHKKSYWFISSLFSIS